jgi:hypothetical protein
MSLLNLTNEIVNLIAQVVAFVFPIGIAIYIFHFKNTKDTLEKYKELKIENVVIPQHERVSKKINILFFSGIATILYTIFTKIITFQFILNSCFLWLILTGAIILLVFTFYLFYSILKEIGL